MGQRRSYQSLQGSRQKGSGASRRATRGTVRIDEVTAVTCPVWFLFVCYLWRVWGASWLAWELNTAALGRKRQGWSWRCIWQQFLGCATESKDNTIKNKLDFVKVKKLLYITGHYQQWENSPQREEIFSSHLSDKDLLSRLHKEFLQLNRKRFKNEQRTWTEISQKKIKMVKKHMKTD